MTAFKVKPFFTRNRKIREMTTSLFLTGVLPDEKLNLGGEMAFRVGGVGIIDIIDR
jgi:hypothetical protein